MYPGIVTGIAPGTAEIIAYTVSSGRKAICAVTVTALGVRGVNLNKSSSTLLINGNEQLMVVITPANATNRNVTWTSSNPAVTNVQAGLVTTHTIGTAVITVKTQDGGHIATCTVSVEPVLVTGIDITSPS